MIASFPMAMDMLTTLLIILQRCTPQWQRLHIQNKIVLENVRPPRQNTCPKAVDAIQPIHAGSVQKLRLTRQSENTIYIYIYSLFWGPLFFWAFFAVFVQKWLNFPGFYAPLFLQKGANFGLWRPFTPPKGSPWPEGIFADPPFSLEKQAFG